MYVSCQFCKSKGVNVPLAESVVCSACLCHLRSHLCVSLPAVAMPTLGGQYPVFSAAPAAAKLMEEGKVHTVEHLINPLAMQHPEHTSASAAAAAAAATVLPAVSTPPPFQVRFGCYSVFVNMKCQITRILS